MFLLKIFLSLWPAGKDLSIRLTNAHPMLVLTFLLYGGLNQFITFLCPLRFCDGGCCVGSLNSIILMYSHSSVTLPDTEPLLH